MLGCNDGNKLGLSDGKVVDTTLEDAVKIELCDDEGSELGSLDGSFDSSSDGNLEGLLLGDSLGSELGLEIDSFDKF